MPAPLSLCFVSLNAIHGAGFLFYYGELETQKRGEKELQNNIQSGKENQKRFLCPACRKHTVLWLLPTTEVKDLPIKCKRCGTESIVNILPEPVPLEPAPCND